MTETRHGLHRRFRDYGSDREPAEVHRPRQERRQRDQDARCIVECWGDDVLDGKLSDLRRAVEAKDDETVVSSRVEWPDKATRDAAMRRMADLMKTDSRIDPDKNPMPFDGKRMIYCRFVPIVELRHRRWSDRASMVSSRLRNGLDWRCCKKGRSLLV